MFHVSEAEERAPAVEGTSGEGGGQLYYKRQAHRSVLKVLAGV